MTESRQDFMRLVSQGNIQIENCCHICGSIENLQLHHIIPLSNGGLNISTNILTLCGECHGKVHNNEGLKIAREKISEKKKGEFILINNTLNEKYECNGWEEVSEKIIELCSSNPKIYQYSRIKNANPIAKTIRSKVSKLKRLYPERIIESEDGSVLIPDFLYKGKVDLKIITTRRKDGFNE